MKATGKTLIVLTILIAAALMFSVCAYAWSGGVASGYAGGAGTAGNPFQIRTEEQLAYFASNVNNGVGVSGKYFRLEKDMDMSGGTWSVTEPFDGHFNGNGHSVTLAGSFLTEIAEGGSVSLLRIVGVGTQENALLCRYNRGSIRSCGVEGSVSGTVQGETALFCGRNYGAIVNCCALGSLSAYNNAGIIARNESGATLYNFYCASTIADTEPLDKYTDHYYGPVVGTNSGTMEYCYYDGTLFAGTASDTSTKLTSDVMQSESFVDTLNENNTVPGSIWVRTESGYPHLELCYGGFAHLSVTDGDYYLYHSESFTLAFTKSDPLCTVYYTLDGSDPRSSGTRSCDEDPLPTLTGDRTVRIVASRDGLYGSVRKQRLIQLLGDGDAEHPYLITTGTQLNAVRYEPDKCYMLGADISFEPADFEQGAEFSGGWVPIPDFSGSLDGAAHAVYGLQGRYGGLIDRNRGTVDALRIIGHRLYKDGGYGAVANSSTGSVTRCYVEAAFTLGDPPDYEQSEMEVRVGGVVGTGDVRYSCNGGAVWAHSNYTYNWLYPGGVTGQGRAESCINRGQLCALSGITTEYVFAGGICASGSAQNCLNVGSYYARVALDYDQQYGMIVGDTRSGFNYSHCVGRIEKDVAPAPGTGNARITVVSSGPQCYCLDNVASPSLCLESSYPELDFENAWMMSPEGPVPQGVMDRDGHCFWAVPGSYTAPNCHEEGSITWACAICGETQTVSLPKTAHEYRAAVTEATCTEQGYTTHTCIYCDDSYVDSYVDALGHDYHDTVTEASCTEQGYTTHVCSRCQDTYTDGYVDALGHDWGEWTTDPEPSCTEPGEKSHTCARCGLTETQTIEALGHDWGEWIVSREATCTENGEKTHSCARCGETETVTIEALGHDYQETVVDPTCTDYGYTDHVCSRCGDRYQSDLTDPLGHEYDDPEWSWRDDYGAATATFPCVRGDHSETLDAEISMTVGSSQTVVTAKVRFNDKIYLDKKTIRLSISETELSIPVFDSAVLKLCFDTGASAKAEWSSSNPDAAAVDEDGVVTALKYGKTTITGTAYGISVSCEVQTLFWDVADPSAYYFKHVYWAAENGITKGYDLEYFDPQGTCTREQMMTFLWRLAGKPDPTSTTSKFPDVKRGAYYYKAVLWGVEKKITAGYSSGEYAGKFGVGLPCTREQAMTFLWRMANKPDPKTTTNKFSDVKSSDYFYKAVLWASENGIANGYGDGTYGVGLACLREHMVTFLSRYASKFM